MNIHIHICGANILFANVIFYDRLQWPSESALNANQNGQYIDLFVDRQIESEVLTQKAHIFAGCSAFANKQTNSVCAVESMHGFEWNTAHGHLSYKRRDNGENWSSKWMCIDLIYFDNRNTLHFLSRYEISISCQRQRRRWQHFSILTLNIYIQYVSLKVGQWLLLQLICIRIRI